MRYIIFLIVILNLILPSVTFGYGEDKPKFGPKKADSDAVEEKSTPSWKKKWVEKKNRTVDYRRGPDGKRYKYSDDKPAEDKKDKTDKAVTEDKEQPDQKAVEKDNPVSDKTPEDQPQVDKEKEEHEKEDS